jgi:DNA-binding LacI/PurR family transcriptional regulator
MSDRRPSSTDVARQAKVSQSAVSRTFTPGASVSQDTRDKVLAAAEALGYRPNLLPRMLHTDRTNMIAVVTGDLANAFYSMVLDAISTALREAGKIVILVRVDSDLALDEVVTDLAGYRVDAVVSALSVHSKVAAKALESIRTPVIQLAHGAVGERIWTVNVDNIAAGRAAADLLLANGGTRFGYIGGFESPNQDRRKRGFIKALAARGLSVSETVCESYSHQGGSAAANALLDAGEIDALFCANDLLACGAMDAARARGLICPRNIKIIGFDNIEQAAWPTYALTTFDQQIDLLVTMVIRAITDGPATPRTQLIDARLIHRISASAI